MYVPGGCASQHTNTLCTKSGLHQTLHKTILLPCGKLFGLCKCQRAAAAGAIMLLLGPAFTGSKLSMCNRLCPRELWVQDERHIKELLLQQAKLPTESAKRSMFNAVTVLYWRHVLDYRQWPCRAARELHPASPDVV